MKNRIFGIGIIMLPFCAIAGTSPYAGMETREIKAISAQEIDDYLNGKGLGYAKTAELNHYPGPKHVLDVAKELALTEEQTKRTQVIFESMKDQASVLGKQLVDKEKELDRQFASGSINTDTLSALVTEIGLLQAKIRLVHLRAHLDQKALLTAQQIHQYDQLRGYGTPHIEGHHHSH